MSIRRIKHNQDFHDKLLSSDEQPGDQVLFAPVVLPAVDERLDGMSNCFYVNPYSILYALTEICQQQNGKNLDITNILLLKEYCSM
jgi:hypothetical protein